MFTRVAVVSTSLVFALPILVVTSAVPRGGDPPPNGCNTGSLQCCDSVQSSNSTAVSILAGILGIDLGSVTGLVGLDCSPISVIGVGGNSCSAQPACCTGNESNGLIVLGCNPINV